MKRHLGLLALLCAIGMGFAQLPDKPGTFRFGIIGDTGTGGRHQYEVGAQLTELQKRLQFKTVVMLGDNIYGGQTAKDLRNKFERPYAALLEAGVKFYAVLGNHDALHQKDYKNFNMEGRTYYTFRPHADVRFFAIDSNRLDRTQLEWLDKELGASKSDWKIAFMHHPLYSSGGRHGSDLPVRRALEPLFLKHGVSLVLAGHDHFYERIKPQKGIHHFVVGGSAKLRSGNARRTDITAVAFDRDNSFMAVEIDKDILHFQAISRTGATVDSGTITRAAVSAPPRTEAAAQ